MRESLSWLRRGINRHDHKLRQILTRRFALVRKIGMLKAVSGMATRDDRRANAIEAQFVQWAEEEGLSAEFATRLWTLIHDESLRLQSKK